ncbi:MAG: sulfite oxidase [Meiothermus sp.]|uniref:sulfite oxidase n=1 Tax=Meiothermus sp. TaxID=1955249 RepID=UPI0025E725CF|nr:sulfite oxidase [Meiothermus sp.]MCS7058520.1 sulfite oxidase [Meiothermus sp.]MCS7195424.1 sulfite oxidase [Meiothermus sp.]MDW8091051.1 sulfite oxidase [Meiothermus sp.]MDW8480940.1 sulfite oxidase [Meiothermus sp.]
MTKKFAENAIDRRLFLKHTAVAGAALGLMGRGLAQQQPTADQLVRGKNPKLVVLSSRPIVMESTLELLASERITSKANLFIRNNIDLPGLNTTEPNVQPRWEIEVTGLVDKPFKITVEELSRLPQTEVTTVLQCSGNGRTFFNPRPSGNPWTYGGIGQVVWRGVLLKTLLEAKGVKLDPRARFITMNASTQGGALPYEKSFPISVMEYNSAMIALGMNGEPLPAVHGGPARLVAAGTFGAPNVKWISKIEFAAGESTGSEQVPRYRVPILPGWNLPILPTEPGSRYNYTLENSRSNWGANINSFILSPLPGSTVKGRIVEVRGVAWNDGLVPIESIEVSVNGGTSWRKAIIEGNDGKFGWYRWVSPQLLAPGEYEVMARATDAVGRTQPLNGNIWWNERGYEWNGVMRVKFRVT